MRTIILAGMIILLAGCSLQDEQGKQLRLACQAGDQASCIDYQQHQAGMAAAYANAINGIQTAGNQFSATIAHQPTIYLPEPPSVMAP